MTSEQFFFFFAAIIGLQFFFSGHVPCKKNFYSNFFSEVFKQYRLYDHNV